MKYTNGSVTDIIWDPTTWPPGPGIDGTFVSAFRRTSTESFYLAGSLRNPNIPEFANQITAEGFEVFSDWFSPGPDTDDFGRDYSKARGRSYREFLNSYAAKNVFEFDKLHMDRCDALVLLMPAGKSAHLELGYTIGRGKPGYLVFEEEPERYEVMIQFATQIFFSRQEFLNFLKEKK
jgi:nucleoside 2-deoxyribosyltransferase